MLNETTSTPSVSTPVRPVISGEVIAPAIITPSVAPASNIAANANGSAVPSAPATDFRLYLQGELVRRCKANPRYSLRAFARFLDVEPSFLSKILNRKRSVTPATLERFGKRLGLSPQQMHEFNTTLAETRAQGPVDKGALLKFQQVTVDQFQMISDWYHYAILELVSVRDFQPNTKWIARVLGINPSEANDAVERLMRLGFLEIRKDGKWINKSGNNTTTGNEFTAAAFRSLQRQVLEKALLALEDLPLELRDQSSLTMAIPMRKLPQAKERIKKFRRELMAFLQSEGTPDAVYHLGVSFYPVMRPENGMIEDAEQPAVVVAEATQE